MKASQSPTNFVQLIKRCALEAFEASKPMAVQIGKVSKTSPLKIRVGQKLELTSDFLVIPEALKKHTEILKIGGSEETVTFPSSLKKGAKVVLIRQQGGNKYVIIGIL